MATYEIPKYAPYIQEADISYIKSLANQMVDGFYDLNKFDVFSGNHASSTYSNSRMNIMGDVVDIKVCALGCAFYNKMNLDLNNLMHLNLMARGLDGIVVHVELDIQDKKVPLSILQKFWPSEFRYLLSRYMKRPSAVEGDVPWLSLSKAVIELNDHAHMPVFEIARVLYKVAEELDKVRLMYKTQVNNPERKLIDKVLKDYFNSRKPILKDEVVEEFKDQESIIVCEPELL